MSPVAYTRTVFQVPENQAWVRMIRLRHEIDGDLTLQDVPEGLRDDVRAFWESKWSTAESTAESAVALPGFLAETVPQIKAQYLDQLINITTVHIMRGEYGPVPREMLGLVATPRISNGDGTAFELVYAVGGPLTDWRRLAREMVETADRLYGRPLSGRRRGSSLNDFIEACFLENITAPKDIAAEYVKAHPDRYPLGTADPGFSTLCETLRKEIGRRQ